MRLCSGSAGVEVGEKGEKRRTGVVLALSELGKGGAFEYAYSCSSGKGLADSVIKGGERRCLQDAEPKNAA